MEPEDNELDYELPVYDPRKDLNGRIRPTDLDSYDYADDEHEREYNNYGKYYA